MQAGADTYNPALEEDLLLRRAQQGDSEAFGGLVQRYMRRAYRAALSLVGSPEDALDLSQDAFARAFRARRRLDPQRPFYPWYYQILRRLCFNFVRDRMRRSAKLEGAASWLRSSARQKQSALRPDRRAEIEDLRRRLEAAIQDLPDRQREVFVLKEFEGLRYREIAQLAGIPIGTVMSRLYSARQRLAQALEEQP